MVVFLDTYAIIEIDKGNKAYDRYSLDVDTAVTTPLNLIEVYYAYLRIYGKKEANLIFKRVQAFTCVIKSENIKEGCEFRLENKKKKLSYADSIGYSLAREYGIPFVTGDKEFTDLPGVDFIK